MKCDLCEDIINYEEGEIPMEFNGGHLHMRCLKEIASWMDNTKKFDTFPKEKKKTFLNELSILKSLYSNSRIQALLNKLIESVMNKPI